MVLKHECLTSLIVGEMQIEDTMRYHFSPIFWQNFKSLTILSEALILRRLQICEGKKGNKQSHTFLAECELPQPLWKRICQYLIKLHMHMLFDQQQPHFQKSTLKVYFKQTRNIYVGTFIVALLVICKMLKTI